MDVRDQQFWIHDLNQRSGNCMHYMYRGEAIFFGILTKGVWRFGLKDLSFATGSRANRMNQYPLKLDKDTEELLEKMSNCSSPPVKGGKGTFSVQQQQ